MGRAVSINLTEHTGDELELRQIAPGMLPLILIEPNAEEDGLALDVDVSLIGLDAATEVLQVVLDALRENGYGASEDDDSTE